MVTFRCHETPPYAFFMCTFDNFVVVTCWWYVRISSETRIILAGNFGGANDCYCDCFKVTFPRRVSRLNKNVVYSQVASEEYRLPEITIWVMKK